MKKCAVVECGCKEQDKVIRLWKNHSTGLVYNICEECADMGIANEETVIIEKGTVDHWEPVEFELVPCLECGSNATLKVREISKEDSEVIIECTCCNNKLTGITGKTESIEVLKKVAEEEWNSREEVK